MVMNWLIRNESSLAFTDHITKNNNQSSCQDPGYDLVKGTAPNYMPIISYSPSCITFGNQSDYGTVSSFVNFYILKKFLDSSYHIIFYSFPASLENFCTKSIYARGL